MWYHRPSTSRGASALVAWAVAACHAACAAPGWNSTTEPAAARGRVVAFISRRNEQETAPGWLQVPAPHP